MKKLILFVIAGLFVSCSKTTYSIKQAFGHFSLEWNGRDNSDVLADPKVSSEVKHKIRLVQKYKEYFYNYFGLKETPIYNETTLLNRDAVSYLVVAAPVSELKPLEHWFPFAGTFPYLGFSEREDAEEFQKELSENYFTYLRPVYAYSTLNRLPVYDNILSSFFYYDDYDLAELIFHELTHTIFFVGGDVDFNESLASYIGVELAAQYFQGEPELLEKKLSENARTKKIYEVIASFAKDYNEKLKKEKPTNKESAQRIMFELGRNKYIQEYAQTCLMFGGKECNWDLTKWNNARLAEFLTYQSKQSLVETIRENRKYSLKELIEYLKRQESKYSSFSEESFSSFLKKQDNS